MRTSDIDTGLNIKPWKPRLEMVPHFTIETNMSCNFKCRSCYNHNRSYVKSFELIKKEIDTGLKRRHADTITILGGEPTLHKDLLKIIRYIKERGLLAQMLTNGYFILNNNPWEKIRELKNSGLDRILLHIDEGQEDYPDPIASIMEFLSISNSLRVLTSVSWTIYKGKQQKLGELIKKFSVYPYFDGFLSVLEKSVDSSIRPDHNPENWPTLTQEYWHLRDSLGIQPSFYLPSSLSDNHVSWLVYLYYINSMTGRTFYVSPRLCRFYQKIYLRIKKRELFGVPPMRSLRGLTLIILGFLEFLLKPSRFISFYKLILHSNWLKSIRYHYIALQDGPEYKPENKSIAMCYHCPDATIRNGLLLPVCLADRVSPLPGSEVPNGTMIESLKKLVNEHLQN